MRLSAVIGYKSSAPEPPSLEDSIKVTETLGIHPGVAAAVAVARRVVSGLAGGSVGGDDGGRGPDGDDRPRRFAPWMERNCRPQESRGSEVSFCRRGYDTGREWTFARGRTWERRAQLSWGRRGGSRVNFHEGRQGESPAARITGAGIARAVG